MRLGLIGDVHAEAALLLEAITRLTACGVDRILCTGDIVDGTGSVDECCRILARYEVLTVRGNHDRWLLSGQMRSLDRATQREAVSAATIAFLTALPATIELDTPMGPLQLCHGLGDNDMAKVGLEDFGYAIDVNDELQALMKSPLALVVNGHTHHAGVRSFQGLHVINAGALVADEDPRFLVLDLAQGLVEVYSSQSVDTHSWPLLSQH